MSGRKLVIGVLCPIYHNLPNNYNFTIYRSNQELILSNQSDLDHDVFCISEPLVGSRSGQGRASIVSQTLSAS